MNRYYFFLTFFFFVTVGNSHAGEQTILMLKEGCNEIALSVVNDWNKDLSKLTVEVDTKKLPQWLSFIGSSRTIDVRCGAKGQEKLYLMLNVTDAPIGAETEVSFTLVDVSGNNWDYTTLVKIASCAPLGYSLHTNYPNPFNPSTKIRYSLKEPQHTYLNVFNALGQKVRELVNDYIPAGIHTVEWDGKNELGEQVSSGVYFYRLEAGSFVNTKRMMLLE